MNLYLDRLPEQDREFSKLAAFASRLSEQAENWPQELTSELYKQLPFLSDYNVNVNLDRVDPARGFGFGYADISNKTERPEVEHEQAGLPHLRIPVVIIERAVKPFSVVLDGEKVMPLTEDRIRQILFNPATFDLSSSAPSDPSLIDPLMPPTRSGVGMGGQSKTASTKEKKAGFFSNFGENEHTRRVERGLKAEERRSGKKTENFKGWELQRALEESKAEKKEKRSSLLLAIAPTLGERDVERFVEKVSSDATLRAGFSRSGISPTLVQVFDHTKRASADERLATIAERIEPSVVSFQKLPGGNFLVKSANVDAFAEGPATQGQVVPDQEVAEAVGPENAQAMQPGQAVTAVSDPVEETAPEVSRSKLIEEFGQYKVQDAMGNSLVGHVFPKILMWDGAFTPQDMAIFTNGSAYAMHDTVAGEFVGKGTNLPSDLPRGDGVFYEVQGGEAVCTAPLTIGSSAAGPDGLPRFIGQDPFGTQVQVSLMDGLKTPMRISDTEYALPSTWKFMRLNNQTQVMTDPTQMNKAASVRAEGGSVTLFYNCGYHLRGGCGLEKISSNLRYDLDSLSAEFMLGVLGVDGATAKQKVAEARRLGSVKLAGLKTITLMSERYGQAEKVASSLLASLPNLRRDLVKEAASLQDTGTVDSILALNFINPENMMTFISYVPELEMAAEKLAEMLLHAYLGMNELPEGAVERSMRNLEEVIKGLKALEHSMGEEPHA